MGSVLLCVCKFCCGTEDDEEHPHEQRRLRLYEAPSAVSPAAFHRMTRGSGSVVPLPRNDYHIAPQGSGDEEDEAHQVNTGIVVETTTCCRSGKQPEVMNAHATGINEFFRKLQNRWRKYDSVEAVHGEVHDFEDIRKPPPASPLRTASSFDASRDIPTIMNEEVVLPGSLLQREMAKKVSADLEEQGDECVICMEGFDLTNPRMPTLCGCGENKTYFHLPCLYQWIEQSEHCPSCRQKLTWEEF